MRTHIFRLLSIAFALGCAQQESKEPADLVLRNGRVITVDEQMPEAQAIAIKGDRILAVGSDRGIEGHISDTTKVIDLAGQLAIPGFIEGHGHFMDLGHAK